MTLASRTAVSSAGARPYLRGHPHRRVASLITAGRGVMARAGAEGPGAREQPPLTRPAAGGPGGPASAASTPGMGSASATPPSGLAGSRVSLDDSSVQ